MKDGMGALGAALLLAPGAGMLGLPASVSAASASAVEKPLPSPPPAPASAIVRRGIRWHEMG
jgi:hypothetical protein